jgi:hypothetical protein
MTYSSSHAGGQNRTSFCLLPSFSAPRRARSDAVPAPPAAADQRAEQAIGNAGAILPARPSVSSPRCSR